VSPADNSRHLQRAAAIRHDTAVQRARGVIEELNRAGKAITFSAVARAAGVSRGWLYNQSDLRATTIIDVRDDTVAEKLVMPAAQRATSESLRQRLDGARDEITRLRADNTALREHLARSLGEQRLRR
jgi:hypothetical protein